MAFDVTMTAVDSVGNTVTGFTGTVTFSSSDAYATFAPTNYAFVAGDHGTKTLASVATLIGAGSQSVSVTSAGKNGTSDVINVGPAAFTKLLVLVPGESTDPGSPTGKTGSPTGQTANAPFSITVYAVDDYWNVTPATDTVAISSSDADADLPPNAALVAGAGSFSVTAQAGGPTTFTATDISDGSKTPSTSTSISVTNSAPTALPDAYSVTQDGVLDVGAAGVLGNDIDPEDQSISVADPRPVSGPAHGSLTLNSDGSFRYVPVRATAASIRSRTSRATASCSRPVRP